MILRRFAACCLVSRNSAGHPASLRCSSLTNSRFAHSSRLARRAPRSRICATILAAGTLALAALACASAPRSGSPPAAAALRVGVAQVDITPEEPIRLTGYGNRVAPYERVEGRLSAKALAFGDGPQAAILITADLIGVPRHITEELAARLRKAGIRREQLAVAATHTHTGPSLAGVLPFIFSTPVAAGEQAVIDNYSRLVVDRLEQVALEALAGRQPASVAWGQGAARFAANRRVLKDGKWVAFGINPDGPVDHDLPVLAVRGLDGTLRALLVSYACHATTLEGKDNVVHGDWPGRTQALLEERHPGAVAMVTIGAGADANPNPRGGGLADVERHAQEIAAEVHRVLSTALRPVTSPPQGRFRYLDLALDRIPAREEWSAQAERKDAEGAFARAMLQRLDRGDALPASVPFPVQTWTFGKDLALVFLGGEVVADYGIRLKQEIGPHVWVNAYSNDVAFYVPSRRMIPEGGYEVDRSMIYYGQPGRLAAGTEDHIVTTVREMMERSEP